jgi:hypothetical protein
MTKLDWSQHCTSRCSAALSALGFSSAAPVIFSSSVFYFALITPFVHNRAKGSIGSLRWALMIFSDIFSLLFDTVDYVCGFLEPGDRELYGSGGLFI